MALVKVALALYYGKDLEILLNHEFKWCPLRFSFQPEKYELWKQITMTIVEKLTLIPILLRIEVPKYMKSIHEEIRRWVTDHNHLLMLAENDCYRYVRLNADMLCWKSDGALDRNQTAKKLIESRYFSIQTRFAVACTYFLEDELWALWCYRESVEDFMPHDLVNTPMLFWWEYLRKGYWRNKAWIPTIDSYFGEPRVACTLSCDLRLRLSPFFPYLSWEKKKTHFLLLFRNNHLDDLRLCLLAMNERERLEMLRKYPEGCLVRCLQWPLQSGFMDLANQLCSYMGTNEFKGVLRHILMEHIIQGFQYFDYVELLKDFWNIIPDFNKREIENDAALHDVIEVVRNYDEKNAPLSLPETMADYANEYNNSLFRQSMTFRPF